MDGEDELNESLARAVTPAPVEPPGDRVDTVRELAAARAEILRHRLPGPRERRRPPMALAAAAAAVLLVGMGAVLGDRLGDEGGQPEFDAALTGSGGSAAVLGELVDTGRIIRFDSDDLPVLPKTEFYEVWFLSTEGEGPTRRISAGTFHPDSEGRSHVTLFAAVDPTVYTQVEVTAEPGDGDPDPADDPVLRGSLRLR